MSTLLLDDVGLQIRNLNTLFYSLSGRLTNEADSVERLKILEQLYVTQDHLFHLRKLYKSE